MATAPLDQGTPEMANPTLTSPVAADGVPVPGATIEIPARQGRALRLRAGQTLRLVNTFGSQVGRLLGLCGRRPARISVDGARPGPPAAG